MVTQGNILYPEAVSASCIWEEIRKPGVKFWSDYSELWMNSSTRSAFQAPSFLHFLSGYVKHPVMALSLRRNGKFLGAVLLEERPRQEFHFLSEHKNDGNYFLFHRDCESGEIELFFEYFFKFLSISPRKALLNDLPEDAPYQKALLSAASASGLHTMYFEVAVSPKLNADSTSKWQRVLDQKSRLHKMMEKFLKNPMGELKISRDADGLEKWVEDYCKCHIQRWKNTGTPSSYQEPERRDFLHGCLDAWLRDGALNLFTLYLNREPIAFSIVLQSGEVIIFHSTCYNTDYARLSPGWLLLGFVLKWSRQQPLKTFDFGYGNEPYKYEFADREEKLFRLMVCSRWQVGFRTKGWVVQRVKSNGLLLRAYRHLKNKIA